MSSQNIIAQ